MVAIGRIAGAAVVAAMLCAGAAQAQQKLTGAGASFPFPIYSKWAAKHKELTGVEVNYQSIGSGGGIKAINDKTVDFAGSDAPLTEKELKARGMTQFPMVVGGVVIIVNLPGVKPGEMKLTSGLLADIYLGKITKWNDARLAAENKGLALPNKDIAVVARADGSGTTWIFTGYLDKVSLEWHQKVGHDKSVKWPTGLGAKGSEGVSNTVKQVEGAIGYVEYAYALENKLAHTQLRNKDGAYVQPTIETFTAAAAKADWKSAPAFYMVLVDQPGKDSWPIAGASFIIFYKDQADKAKGEAMLKYFDWCLAQGGDMAKDLHYVPMPQNVIDLVKAD